MRGMDRRSFLASLGAIVPLAGCGGGVYVGWGGEGDFPPSVSLAATVDRASPGDTVRFTAAATDDFEVRSVTLYRRDRDGRNLRIETQQAWPWTFDVVIPAEATGTLRYFARAEDDVGQTGDSAFVEILVV